MSRKRHSVEHIINHLWEAELLLAQGRRIGEICRQIGVSEQSCYRRPRHYNVLRLHSALGCLPPAPKAILPRAADLAAAQGLRADRRFNDGSRSLN